MTAVVYPSVQPNRIGAFATSTLDAAGEYADMVGMVHWEDGADHNFTPGGGGKIWWVGGNHTFNNGGTTLRMGIQDPNLDTGPPVRGDGTYNVYADYVGGTDTLTDNSRHEIAMETNAGESPLPHGALRVVRFELTAHGGGDAVVINHLSHRGPGMYPTCTNAVPTPVTLNNAVPNIILIADDGAVGWICGSMFAETSALTNYDSGSTPDEYAVMVKFPRPYRIWGLEMNGYQGTNSGAGVDFRLFRTPTGTPSQVAAVTIDPTAVATASSVTTVWSLLFPTPYYLPANQEIAAAVRPNDATSDVQIQRFSMGTTSQAKKAWRSLNGIWRSGSRSGNTGAFTADDDMITNIGLLLEPYGPSARGRSMVGVM